MVTTKFSNIPTGGEYLMHTLRKIALALVIIGAINWGLIALFQFDLVATLFGGQDAALSRIIYGLVGLSGLICLSFYFDPETDTSIGDNRDMRANQANFGTEFSDELYTSNQIENGIKEERNDNEDDNNKM